MTNDERGDGRDGRDFNEAEAIFALAMAFVKLHESDGDGPEGEGGENGGEQ